MNTTILTLYVLVWPALSALVLATLVWAVWKDIRRAKRSGKHLV